MIVNKLPIKVLAVAIIVLLMLGLSGCEGKDDTLNIYGTWYRDGNANSAMFVVNNDNTWQHYKLQEDFSLALEGQGTVIDTSDSKEIKLLQDDGEYRLYSLKNDIIKFSNHSGIYYIRDTDSIDYTEYEGTWYLDGDSSKDYYNIGANGSWDYFKVQGGGAYSVDGGFCTWDAKKKQILAYQDGEVFAAFDTKTEGQLKSKQGTFIK